MERYNEFLDRINKFSLSSVTFERKHFETSSQLSRKVDKNNCFKRYYGDTTVFDLEEKDKEKISSMISKLYETVPECFCERLGEATLHMTMHDLTRSPDYESIKDELQKNENQIKDIFNMIKIIPDMVRMKTHFVVNSSNISLILLLLPVDETEYTRLMTIYHLIDGVQKLNYKFTPHVTLGYYNINGFDASSAIKLEGLVKKMNQEKFEINISLDKLFYQHFTSMNNYNNICRLTECL